MKAVLQPKRIIPFVASKLLSSRQSSDRTKSPNPTVVKLDVEKYKAASKVGISLIEAFR